MTDGEKLNLAKKLYLRAGFFAEFLNRLDGKKTIKVVYYELEEVHDDLFGVFKFSSLNAFYIWSSSERRKRKKMMQKELKRAFSNPKNNPFRKK